MNSFELEGFLERTYEENSRQIIMLLQQVQNITRSNNEIIRYLSQLRRQRNRNTPVRIHPQTTSSTPSTYSTNYNITPPATNITPPVTTSFLQPETTLFEYQIPLTTTANPNVIDQYLLQLAQQFFPHLQSESEIPTPQQIAQATRQSLYQNIVHPLNTQCPIALTSFNDNDPVTIIRQCRHIFHTADLSRWFQTHCRCPVCRYDIRTYIAPEEEPIMA
jgi:hypothetical protein